MNYVPFTTLFQKRDNLTLCSSTPPPPRRTDVRRLNLYKRAHALKSSIVPIAQAPLNYSLRPSPDSKFDTRGYDVKHNDVCLFLLELETQKVLVCLPVPPTRTSICKGVVIKEPLYLKKTLMQPSSSAYYVVRLV